MALAGCTETPVRPQLLLFVDTDAPTVGQAVGEPSLSSDAAIDAVRIDVLEGAARETRTLVAVAPDDWPVSIGLVGSGESYLLRIRGFSQRLATADADGELAPRQGLGIDRLVWVETPNEGVAWERVTLELGCFGVPADLETEQSCATTPTEVVAVGLPHTQVGTASLGREAPCRGEYPHASARCIPGGFSIMGDHVLVDDDEDGPVVASTAMRATLMAPFWLDEHELTVGEVRLLVQQGAVLAPPTQGASGLAQYCTYRGLDDSSHDTMPLTCVSRSLAEQICEARGGMLPTEAQWEHAARGRGQARRYPWGESLARCCVASLSRPFEGGPTVECDPLGGGPEPVGSHLPSEDCEGEGDLSRDGIWDMGGSVAEWVADGYTPGCFDGVGILNDPVCAGDGARWINRGGNWSSGIATALAARRLAVDPAANPVRGVRCAYVDR